MIGKSWTSSSYFSNSTGWSVTSNRFFSPFIISLVYVPKLGLRMARVSTCHVMNSNHKCVGANFPFTGWKLDLGLYKFLRNFLILLTTNQVKYYGISHSSVWMSREPCQKYWHQWGKLNGMHHNFCLKIFFLSMNFWFYDRLLDLKSWGLSRHIALASLFLCWACLQCGILLHVKEKYMVLFQESV